MFYNYYINNFYINVSKAIQQILHGYENKMR